MPLPVFGAGQRLYAADLQALVAKINQLSIPPSIILRRAAVQNIASGAATLITFDTEDTDTDNLFTPSSTDVTIRTPGIYVFNLGGAIAGATGLKVWEILKNGVIQRGGAATGPDTVAQAGRTNAVISTTCIAGDVIRGQAFQNSGAGQDVTATFAGWKYSD